MSPKRGDVGLIPHDEAERLSAVRRYHILDTPPDPVLDRITALAARLFQVPVAIVSIVDSDRIWFKSCHGVKASGVERETGMCSSAILQYAPFIVADTRTDPRVAVNQLKIGDFGVRFYAAAPLTTIDGYNIGTFCIIDRHPRKVSDADIVTLQDLASIVMQEIELRLAASPASETEHTLLGHLLKEKREAEHIAKQDALTGLGNRRRFDEAFAAELNRVRRHGGSLCLMMADIDHFKRINDRRGHAVGDKVLKRLSEQLAMCLRPTDVLTRFGGDEFVVLMPHTQLSEALATAERLRITLASSSVAPIGQPVTASFGVAELQQKEEQSSILRRVDRALYRSKRSGRNAVVAAKSAAHVGSSTNT